MRMGVRQVLTWVAIYAVAMHTLLTGVAPTFAAAQDSVDPFSVICLHDADAGSPASQQPSGPVPGHACEHCNLCSASAPPAAPDVALIGDLVPMRVSSILRPVSTIARPGVPSDPKQARGPPQFA